ncbi:maleylpyruvate isomerase family mycothiol-dependent enzyme [Nocardia tengchongensis]|uniref:Maleylpyruvate isomerase family mycothiol-dependent enzyme n=1 Tax=Nocardia tengchongensis TaxID=2055889 RepID=A0ABX8CIX5_9NOCA|nr:maleylpyruvate isomerase family mycothiol-dependent enzyme [Nocardia tengchongensis]QVI19469.1 maleylpyruvate isomerase family mycothiol-dependent enzyme [Nocardia tengchongensis]
MDFAALPLPERLLITQRGTAFFARRLSELTDDELDGDTLLPGWTRRHLVAHVGYNAAALCRLLDWASSGVETPMYESAEQRGREIDEGATLPPAAIRNLFTHTAARLAERWRSMPASAWDSLVRTAQGRTVPASETAWMRTREVWIHAVDLGNGGRFGEFPDVVLDGVLADVVTLWRARDRGAGLSLCVDGRPSIEIQASEPTTTSVSGPLAAVVRWATGRGAVGVDIKGEETSPAWL